VSTNSTTRADLDKNQKGCPLSSRGAKDGVRTRDLDLGKVALYQLSYYRKGLSL
jgi:hypothetical protein